MTRHAIETRGQQDITFAHTWCAACKSAACCQCWEEIADQYELWVRDHGEFVPHEHRVYDAFIKRAWREGSSHRAISNGIWLLGCPCCVNVTLPRCENVENAELVCQCQQPVGPRSEATRFDSVPFAEIKPELLMRKTMKIRAMHVFPGSGEDGPMLTCVLIQTHTLNPCPTPPFVSQSRPTAGFP